MALHPRRPQANSSDDSDSFGEGLLEDVSNGNPTPAGEVDDFDVLPDSVANESDSDWSSLLDSLDTPEHAPEDDIELSVLELLEAHAGQQEEQSMATQTPKPKEYNLQAELEALDDLDLDSLDMESLDDFAETEALQSEHSLPEVGEILEGAEGDETKIQELQQRLQEKETLIEFLTDRLEQTVDQLDRLQRTGGNRTRSGGVPNEMLEEQRQMLQDLQAALDQWTEMQLGLSLGKLEMQVTELRSLIVEQVVPARREPEPPAHRSPASEPKKQPAPGEKTSSVWEAMKAQMLNGDKPTPPMSGKEQDESAHESVVGLEQPFIELEELKAPALIDLETATPAEIAQAIDARDEFIVRLTKQLRSLASQRYRAPDWSTIGDCPENLKSSLQRLEERIRETLRVAEVELSMERARLGREEIRLRQLKEDVDKRLKRLGLNGTAEPEKKSGKNASQDAASGRWKRFLGINPHHDPEND